jgi:hypothetical protein
MSPGRRSPRLAATVVQQSARHSALRRITATQAVRRSRPGSHDAHGVTVTLEIDLRSRLKTEAIPQFLWDDDLALSPYSLGHTYSITGAWGASTAACHASMRQECPSG